MTRLECRVEEFLANNKDIIKIGNIFSCSRSPYKVKLPTEFTSELCRFIGILHGDGNMSFSRILISDKSLLYHKNVLCKIFQSLFGIKLRLFEDKKRHTYYSHIKSKIIYKYLDEVLEVPRGSIRKNLFVPIYLKNLSNELQASYFGGLFDSEGYVSKRQAQANFYTTNKEIFDFVKSFLKSNNIDFSVYTRTRRPNKEYEIYIYSKERLKKLHNLIQIRHPEKLSRLHMFSVH